VCVVIVSKIYVKTCKCEHNGTIVGEPFCFRQRSHVRVCISYSEPEMNFINNTNYLNWQSIM